MDKKDEGIIRILSRQSGISSRALSKMTGIPISTVHRRIQKLEKEGVIVGYKAIIDNEKTTKPISALLFVNLAEVIPQKGHIPEKKIISILRNYEEIEEMIEVQAYNFDIVIKVRVQSLRKLSAFIEELRSIEGIEELTSAIITEETILPPPIVQEKSVI
jgi:DNA-binding Lrp family transcriptional regulator